MPFRRLSGAFLTAAMAATATLAGCAPDRARSFAVVLEEPPNLECVPKLGSANIDLQGFFITLTQTPTSWHDQYESGQLKPTGATLHGIKQGDGDAARAWFDPMQTGMFYRWNGVLFDGDLHDDYIDVSNVVSHDASASDSPYRPTQECGELTDVESDLLATIDGGSIVGRLRRTQYTYFADGDWLCASFVACSENVTITGEEER